MAAISEKPSETDGKVDAEKSSSPLEWKSFDMHAVVASTEDLFKFIISEKGFRVRLFIVRDILKVADIFLDDQVSSCMYDENLQPRPTLESEVDFIHHLYCSMIRSVTIFVYIYIFFLFLG